MKSNGKNGNNNTAIEYIQKIKKKKLNTKKVK